MVFSQHAQLRSDFEGLELLLVLGEFFGGGVQVEDLEIVVVDSHFVGRVAVACRLLSEIFLNQQDVTW